MRADDAPVVAAYRNDPAINHFQDWDLPYSEETFLSRLAASPTFDTIPEGRWVNLALELQEPGGATLVGDIACHLHDGGRIVELGYTLRSEYQGRGFASEAAGALVDHLLATTEAHRFEASLDEENVASMRVLEAIGMTFESFSRQSYPIRGSWEDDTRCAMLRDDRVAWLARPDTPPSDVQLVEITPEDAYLWGRLRTHHSQERYVSPMALTFRDALFPEVIDGAPVVPWMRGVLADGERVAFVMIAEVTDHHPEPYLWRLLVDRMHQRRGIGRMIIAELRRMLHEQGHRTLTTSWGEGPGSPRSFYEGLGFVATGRQIDDETEARLSW